MTTPAFNPISTLFNSVRLYTQFDPYYYTVDNRPLNDMLNNTSTMSNGVDAARLTTLLNSLNANLLDTAVNGDGYNVMLGLTPSSPASLTLRIGVGAFYKPLAVNNSISQTILKKAILQEPTDIVYTAPGTGGHSIVHTIECRYVDISASTTNSNFVDSGNSVQFDTCLDGILELQLISGTSAATGSEAVPATTSGWTPLYNIHVANGASTYSKIYAHENSPRLYVGTGLKKELTLTIPAAAGATSVTTLSPIPAFQFAEGSDQSVVGVFTVSGTDLNPFKDIIATVEYTSSVNTGNFAFAMSYCVIKEGDTMSTVSFTSPVSYETLTPPGTANYLVTNTLAAKIPGHVLQNAKMVAVKLTRLSSTQSGVDTSTGNMLVTGAVLTQV